MNHNRLRSIIEAYGTREENWPDEERADALALLGVDKPAQQLLADYSFVDEALDSLDAMPGADLRDRILQRLQPRHWVDRCIAWLLPDIDELREYFWRPVLAASLPLVTGLLLGASTLTTNLTSDLAADTSFSWEDELTLLALDNSVMETLDGSPQ